MKPSRIQIYLRDNYITNQHEMMIFEERDGHRFAVQPMVFKKVTPGNLIQPSLVFSADDLVPQQLIKEIRAMGLIENADRETVAALKYHLEDMRRIALNSIDSGKDIPHGKIKAGEI